jgi:acetyl esterase/lipase
MENANIGGPGLGEISPFLDGRGQLVDVSFVKRKFLDVPYGTQSAAQALDVFLPDTGDGPFPLIVYVHGGGFSMGDKRDDHCHILKMLEATQRGYAMATISYRLSGEVAFPAAVLDCRAAIRFLKENSAKYSVDPSRIGVLGDSAGGNLCGLLAMNVPDGEFLGEEGLASGAFDSSVMAAVDWFGPTDFLLMDKHAADAGFTPMGNSGADSMESLYLGAPLPELDPDYVQKANPMTYIGDAMAALFVEHGVADRIVPIGQSIILVDAIRKKLGEDRVKFIQIPGAEHEGPQFVADENMDEVWAFFKSAL